MRRSELAATPRAENDIGVKAHDVQAIGNDPAFAHRFFRKVGETVIAAGNAHQLRHPGNRTNMRVIPFFKKHLWAAFKCSGGLLYFKQAALHSGHQLQPERLLADHSGKLVHHGENLGHVALVEDRDLNTFFNQLRGDVGLQV